MDSIIRYFRGVLAGAAALVVVLWFYHTRVMPWLDAHNEEIQSLFKLNW